MSLSFDLVRLRKQQGSARESCKGPLDLPPRGCFPRSVARKARIEFPCTCYHLLDRGDRGKAIFYDEADRARFLATLGQVCTPTGWRVRAFVLMRAQREDISGFLTSKFENLSPSASSAISAVKIPASFDARLPRHSLGY